MAVTNKNKFRNIFLLFNVINIFIIFNYFNIKNDNVLGEYKIFNVTYEIMTLFFLFNVFIPNISEFVAEKIKLKNLKLTLSRKSSILLVLIPIIIFIIMGAWIYDPNFLKVKTFYLFISIAIYFYCFDLPRLLEYISENLNNEINKQNEIVLSSRWDNIFMMLIIVYALCGSQEKFWFFNLLFKLSSPLTVFYILAKILAWIIIMWLTLLLSSFAMTDKFRLPIMVFPFRNRTYKNKSDNTEGLSET